MEKNFVMVWDLFRIYLQRLDIGWQEDLIIKK